jgi:hypothetical protein
MCSVVCVCVVFSPSCSFARNVANSLGRGSYVREVCMFRCVVLVRCSFQLRPAVQSALRLWANSFRCTTNDLELQHGACKRRTCQLSTWHLSSARHINAVADQLCRPKYQDEKPRARRPLAQSQLESPEKTAAPKKNLSRAVPYKSALQYYHKIASKRDRLAGHVFNPVSKEYWATVREEWNSLSDQDLSRHSAYISVHMSARLCMCSFM